MIAVPVSYSGDLATQVSNYNSDPSIHSGEYWEEGASPGLKSHIKGHYISQQGYRCCYCRQSLRTEHGRIWDVEHVVAKSTHPHFLFTPVNLAVSCVDCNSAKGNQRTLRNGGLRNYPTSSAGFLIVHPHFDNYSDHIAVVLDCVYIAKSDRGRDTISMCNLMRYTYRYMAWDEKLANKRILLEKMAEVMASSPEEVRSEDLMAILMIAQIGVSRELLQ